MPKVYLDIDGLNTYNKNVIKALEEKASKVHVGTSEPEYTRFETWFDTTEEDTQAVSLMSLDDEELTFNEDSGEDLTFNEEDGVVATSDEPESEELTFNESSDDEELIFNE